ncbi:hypothetical protein [Hymenobacter sp.]|uniref:hypothetical protein n=1 Tax=Hymenobacter sp. TaxID=1898978 RepID=UPI00286C5D4C|nr:hypothetical protein [Hymenobacter sp.]
MAANPTPLPDTAVAQLNIPDFVAKWDLRFADNTFQDIREGDFREFKNDLVKVFANWKELTTRRVKGSTYPVPFTDSLGTIPALYLVAGMNAVAVNGTDAASAAAGAVAPSITYQLIRDSRGPVSALTDVAPTTTTRTPTRWVQVSGSEAEKTASFPVLVLEDFPYRAGDVVQFTFAGGETRLFEWRADSVGFQHPEPTGADDDPVYKPFSPLASAALYDDTQLRAQVQAVAQQLNGKAGLNSPAFSGAPTAPTAPATAGKFQLANLDAVRKAFADTSPIVTRSAAGITGNTAATLEAATNLIDVGGTVYLNRPQKSDYFFLGGKTIDCNHYPLDLQDQDLNAFDGAVIKNNRLLLRCRLFCRPSVNSVIRVQGGIFNGQIFFFEQTATVVFDGCDVVNFGVGVGSGGFCSTPGGKIILRNGSRLLHPADPSTVVEVEPVVPGAGGFEAIAENQYGTHPPFSTSSALYAYLLDRTPPSNAASALVPITKYNANAGTLAAGNGHLAFSQFSYASLQHNGTSAKIGVWSNLPNNPTGSTDAQFAPNNDTNRSPVGIGIVDDGAPVTMPNGTQIASVTGIAADTEAGSIQYITVPLPGTGTRVTDFYNSYVQNYGSTGVLWGACVVSVEIFGTAITAVELTNITDGPTVVVAESDSTGGGIQSDAPYLTGHIGKMKPLRPSYTFKLVGAGGAYVSNRYDTAAKRSLRADEAVACWGNTSNPVYLFGTDGINDWATRQATGAQMGAMVGLFFDELKSRKPNVKILLVSPYLTTIEAGNDKLESAPSMRAGIESARNGRDSFVWYLDGSTLTNELYDPVHPSTLGYAQSAPKISAGFNFSTGAAGDSVPGAALLFPNNTGTLVYANELLTTSANDAIGDDTGYKESGVANWKRPAGAEAYVMMQNTVTGAGNAVLGWNTSKEATTTARLLPVGMFLDPGTGDVYVKDTGVDQDGNTPGIQLYGRKIMALPIGHWLRIRIISDGSAFLEQSEDKLAWAIAYQFGQAFAGDAFPTAVLFCNATAKMYKPQLGTGLVAA